MLLCTGALTFFFHLGGFPGGLRLSPHPSASNLVFVVVACSVLAVSSNLPRWYFNPIPVEFA